MRLPREEMRDIEEWVSCCRAPTPLHPSYLQNKVTKKEKKHQQPREKLFAKVVNTFCFFHQTVYVSWFFVDILGPAHMTQVSAPQIPVSLLHITL